MKFEDMINTIQLGDCYELIKNIPDNSIDCIYTDIPYDILIYVLYFVDCTLSGALCSVDTTLSDILFGIPIYVPCSVGYVFSVVLI